MRSNRYRELHRYAVAGNAAKTREVLERLLRQDPDDALLREELARLAAGEPLLAAQPTARFHAVVADSLVGRLQEIALQTPQDTLRLLPADKRDALGRQVHGLWERLEEVRGEPPRNLRSYIRQLDKLQLKRRLRSHRKTVRVAAASLALLAVVWSAGAYLHSQAVETRVDLEQAMQDGRWHDVCSLSQSADRGVYSFLHPPIKRTVSRAGAWMQEKRRACEAAEKHLQPLLRGERSVESIPLAERAAIERELVAVPSGLGNPSAVWKELCLNAQEKLDQLRQQEMARLQAPLQDWPQWTNDAAADAEALRAMQAEARQRLTDYQDAIVAYHLPAGSADSVQERLAQIDSRLAELEPLQQTMDDLAHARTLEEYTQALRQAPAADWYRPASALKAALQSLPKGNTLRNLMANPDAILPADFVEEARHTFLEAGPTFTALNPANTKQVERLEEFFTTRTLHTRIFEVEDREGRTAYAADKPVISKNGDWLTFKRDILDPAYQIGEDQTYAWQTRGVHVRTMDASPLLTHAGLQKIGFYNRVNIPKAMGVVLNTESSTCPVLARAYIFDTLLQLIQEHDDRTRLGLRFSPSLQEDIQSFEFLRNTVIGELQPGCWLAPSPAVKHAAEEFQRWFEEHKGRNYAKEIAANYGAIARVHPAFVGYVAMDGSLQLRQGVPADAELWYVAQDGGIHHAPQPQDGRAWEQAQPFSPLFILEKDTP